MPSVVHAVLAQPLNQFIHYAGLQRRRSRAASVHFGEATRGAKVRGKKKGGGPSLAGNQAWAVCQVGVRVERTE